MVKSTTPADTGRTTTDLSGARGRVLSAVRAAGAPVSIEELAADLGLHANTIRFHTSALEEDGLIEQGRQQTGAKGRPKAVFVPTRAGSRSGARNYQLLAAVLVDHLAQVSEDPLGAAHAAGKAWGQALAGGRPAEEALGQSGVDVAGLLEEMGFEPQSGPNRIELHNCPFRELVDDHQQLVCTIHQGLLDGMSEVYGHQGDGPVPLVLQPFAAPGICAVHLDKKAK
jgi:predicted ArsR family transcriptional regulator